MLFLQWVVPSHENIVVNENTMEQNNAHISPKVLVWVECHDITNVDERRSWNNFWSLPRCPANARTFRGILKPCIVKPRSTTFMQSAILSIPQQETPKDPSFISGVPHVLCKLSNATESHARECELGRVADVSAAFPCSRSTVLAKK